MADDLEIQEPIESLGDAGLRLWNEVVEENERRPDELRLLSSACRLADHIESIEKALIGQDLIVKGSQGQPVAQPLLAEIRQYRSTQASLLRQLALSDEEEDQEAGTRTGPMSREESARKAAHARWAKHKGKKL